ncbi:MAG: cohesin domain-containing protein [Clostridiales bacterium]|jgi:hypothetical protein|nr:cohesin domain-containing protein [Clostridiales bacterium]
MRSSAYKPIEAEPTIVVGSAMALPGDIVKITYHITDNNTGFNNLDLELPYNSKFFQPISVDSSPLNYPDSFFLFNPAFSPDVMKIIFIKPKEVVGDGLLFTVTYQIDNDPPASYCELPLDVGVIKFQSGNYIDGFVDHNVHVKQGTLVISRLSGVSVSGRISSYNPGNSTTIRLMNADDEIAYEKTVKDIG